MVSIVLPAAVEPATCVVAAEYVQPGAFSPGLTMLVTVMVVNAIALRVDPKVIVRTKLLSMPAAGGLPGAQLAVQAATDALAPCVKPVRVTTTFLTLLAVIGVKEMVTVLVAPGTADDSEI